MNLYEISADFRNTLIELENEEDEELKQDTIEAFNILLNEKSEHIIYADRMAENDINSVDNEIKRLQEIKKHMVKKREKYIKYITKCMEIMGKTKIETPVGKILFRKSKRIVINDENKIPQKYYILEPKLLKTDVKKAIERGEKIEGAKIIEFQNLQIK